MRQTILYIILLFIVASCDNSEYSLYEKQFSENNFQLIMQAQFHDYNVPKEQNSRSVDSKQWNIGDVIYIYADSRKIAQTKYDEYTGWVLSTEIDVIKNKINNCTFWYISNRVNMQSKEGELNETSQVFKNEGFLVYDSDSNVFYVYGQFNPITSRFRLKGAVGDSIFISNFKVCSSFNINKGLIVFKEKTFLGKINSEGYSDYFYGILSDEQERTLSLITEEFTYTKRYSNDFFNIGHSGAITVPTYDNHNSWQCINTIDYCAKDSCIDMGLSVKWATFNIGASHPEDYGGAFVWGCTSPNANYFNTGNLKKHLTSQNGMDYDIAGSMYDAAFINWGSGWHIPTPSQAKELLAQPINPVGRAYGC